MGIERAVEIADGAFGRGGLFTIVFAGKRSSFFMLTFPLLSCLAPILGLIATRDLEPGEAAVRVPL
jgi:hypothetical protein